MTRFQWAPWGRSSGADRKAGNRERAAWGKQAFEPRTRMQVREVNGTGSVLCYYYPVVTRRKPPMDRTELTPFLKEPGASPNCLASIIRILLE